MFNAKIKMVSSLLFILILIGCGGSGGGTEQVSPSVNNNDVETMPSTAETHELSGEKPIAMSELIASEDFSFTSKQKVEVRLDLSDLHNQTGQRAYVSIYGDYKLLSSGRFYPDASSRIFSGELHDGLFNHSFVSLNNQPSYLIEVWFYNGEQPIQKQLTVFDSYLTWEL